MAYLITASLLAIAVLLLLALMLLRLYDAWQDQREWRRLQHRQATDPAPFDPERLRDQAEPVQRFFRFAIAPGTPLFTVAEIDMVGEFSLGSKERPAYRPMRAKQILAAPHGFVWRLRLPGISGSDSHRWTRFRLFGLIPVAHIGGTDNHRRSAFGRYIAEALFWTPAALLPSDNMTWQAIDHHRCRVTVRHEGLEQSVDLQIDDEGRPQAIKFQRWSNANDDKKFRLQPFGGYLSDFRYVQGFQLPFRVEAGNQFDTEHYFPFFKAELTSVRFPGSSS